MYIGREKWKKKSQGLAKYSKKNTNWDFGIHKFE
jgi:hypothetical protein